MHDAEACVKHAQLNAWLVRLSRSSPLLITYDHPQYPPDMATDDTHAEQKPGLTRWAWSLTKVYTRKTWRRYKKLPIGGKVCRDFLLFIMR